MDNASLYHRLQGPQSRDHLIEIWRDETGQWIAKATGAPDDAADAIEALLAALNHSAPTALR